MNGVDAEGETEHAGNASVRIVHFGPRPKTFTAIPVMQLWEQGLFDLDAPRMTTCTLSG